MGRGVLIGVLVILGLGVLIGGGLGLRYLLAEPKGIVEAEEKIQSGSNRIDKYNHFFDTCAKAQEYQDKIAVQLDQLENADSKDEKESIRTRLSGLKGMFSDTVRSYNQDARKNYTAGQFRSSKLPYQLPTDWQKEVVCSVQ